MGKKQRTSKNLKTNPFYIVFCEGESEESYITHLRSIYGRSIRLITKITNQNISDSRINDFLKFEENVDAVFLLYDIDSEEIKARLNKIKMGIKLFSNPVFELWLLLHFAKINCYLTAEECVKKLKLHDPKYEKGRLSEYMKQLLQENYKHAIERAKKMTYPSNPSTTVYFLLEKLENI